MELKKDTIVLNDEEIARSGLRSPVRRDMADLAAEQVARRAAGMHAEGERVVSAPNHDPRANRRGEALIANAGILGRMAQELASYGPNPDSNPGVEQLLLRLRIEP